ncbi:Uncharacterised protein [Klebsiella quasipneumoniae]|uniref:hypothetical protein n=1 Tax=Klebsiella quasipneumoniae TaxID=1463165 RepID=UPI000F6CF910|nr:hypothetical protein [Klebsiella quasipneumoniae]VEB78492.1 Uncharacterised protein [Klebsiella quasipneumoniae]
MSDQNVNPYLSGADAAPQQSPYMAAPIGADNGASRFSSAPADADFLRTQPVNGNAGDQWDSGNIANQQDQNADSTGAQVGDTIPLMDGTAVEYTAELQGLMGQFHQSIESQLGKGTVDAMLQYAGTLDAGTQATLERMVLSGDPAQMQRAVQYLQERMACKRTARTVLTGMCYSVGSVMRQGSSSLTRLTGQSAMTSRTWRR